MSKINYNPPYELEKAGSVDKFFVFDNKDHETAEHSLKETMKMISGD